MRIKLSGILIILLIVVGNSCREKYWPEVNKYENLLVVDGGITNQAGPYTVTLSRSSSVNDPMFIPLTGCQIIISDDIGNEEVLQETGFGSYQTSEEGIQGVVGRSYKIMIITNDDNTYETDFAQLPAPVEIDSVYFQTEFQGTTAPDYYPAGYQFYISSEGDTDQENYYLWRVKETYEYNSDFTIEFIFVGHIERYPDPFALYKCWATEYVPSFYTFSTDPAINPSIEDFPLNFVSTESKRLTIRYSLLVEQLSLPPEAYKYWDDLAQLNEQQGDLYSSQPYQIRGNVYNINDPDEPVLGYFNVAGLSTKRIFANPPDLDFTYGRCTPDTDLRFLFTYPPSIWPVYITIIGMNQMALSPPPCFDCRLKGGVLDMPDYWYYDE